MARVSMRDVARLAGVSGQTVSRVVNDSPRVDPVTRRRVEDAMRRLGYRPHRAARALRTGRTQTIGLVVSTLATVGNSRMLQAVADAAALRGYALTVVSVTSEGAAGANAAGASAAGASALTEAFDRLRDQGVDGAILLNEATALARDAGVPTDVAVVVVDSPADDRFAVIQSDHESGARRATAHLLESGHATVWHLAGPADSYAASERERGWRAALEGAGRVAPPVVRGDWSAASGHANGVILAARQDVSAVFVSNDQMALGLLRAVADAGRAVPDDIAVVGFDDIADAADYRPPLTTVRQDFDLLGVRAVDALIAAIDGRSPLMELVSTELIIRASSSGGATNESSAADA